MRWIKHFGLRISNIVPDRFRMMGVRLFFLCVTPNMKISLLHFNNEKVILNRAPQEGQR